MKRFGYFYGNKGRRKFRALFENEFDRNCYADADAYNGFRVRKFNLKEPEKVYYGA